MTATPSPLERGARALAKAQSGVDDYDALDEGFQATLKENVAAVLEASGEEWQPIDSAPKDGTRFLAYTISRGPGDRAPSYQLEIGHWTGDYHHAQWGIPTHWLPLPSPPQ